MTKTKLIWAAVVGAAAGAALVLAHLLVLPIDASWQVNRLLHYAWEAVSVLAGVGGIVWMMWRRPKALRRDEDRLRARRRLIGVGVIVIALAGLVIFAEVHRELQTRDTLKTAAVPDLQAIAEAVGKYAADHGGAHPKKIEELVPKYLDPGRLYYCYRDGPSAEPAPAEANAPPPSYALAKEPLTADAKKRPEARAVAYLRPGEAWAPLVVILEKDGRAVIVGDNAVRTFEAQFEQ